MKPPTRLEREFLEAMLREYRRAMRRRSQLSILLDPWVAGLGLYIHASVAGPADTHTYQFPKEEPRSRVRARKRK